MKTMSPARMAFCNCNEQFGGAKFQKPKTCLCRGRMFPVLIKVCFNEPPNHRLVLVALVFFCLDKGRQRQQIAFAAIGQFERGSRFHNFTNGSTPRISDMVHANSQSFRNRFIPSSNLEVRHRRIMGIDHFAHFRHGRFEAPRAKEMSAGHKRVRPRARAFGRRLVVDAAVHTDSV